MSNNEIRDEIAERSAEIALNTIDTLKKEIEDKDIRLNETFFLIEDKDKEIERQRLAIGEMEIRIEDLKKKPTEQLAKLQADYDMKCEEVKELKAVEAIHTRNQDFNPASKIASPKQIWVAAVNAYHVYKGLHDGSMWATSHNEPWKKVIFDVADDGQLKDSRLEGI